MPISSRALITVLAIILAVIGIAVAFSSSIWPIERQVTLTLSLDSSRCVEDGRDVLLSVMNNSSRQINNLSADIDAFHRGYSNALASDTFYTDKIMPPGAAEEYCIRRPGLDRKAMSEMMGSDFTNPYRDTQDSDLVLSGNVTDVQAD